MELYATHRSHLLRSTDIIGLLKNESFDLVVIDGTDRYPFRIAEKALCDHLSHHIWSYEFGAAWACVLCPSIPLLPHRSHGSLEPCEGQC